MTGKFNRDILTEIVQIVFFILVSFFLISSIGGETITEMGWFYYIVYAISSFFHIIFAAIFRNRIRHIMVMVVVMVNSFLIPYTIYVLSLDLKVSFIIAVCYILAVMAIAERDAAIGTFTASVMFAFYCRHNVEVNEIGKAMKEAGHGEYWRIVLAYLAIAVLALGWRMVISRLYAILHRSIGIIEREEAGEGTETEKKIDSLNGENVRLRTQLAKSTIEINTIVGYDGNNEH